MAKLTYNDKTNQIAPSDRDRQATAEDFNEIKGVVNTNDDLFTNKQNTAGVLYLKGDETTEGSVRFNEDSDVGEGVFETLVSGVWQPTTMEFGTGSVFVGPRVGIAAFGHHIATEDTIPDHLHLHAHNVFSGGLTTLDARIIDSFSFTEREVAQPDNTGEFSGTLFEFLLPTTQNSAIIKAYFQTGATVSTEPTRIQCWEGTDDTGPLIFDQTYPTIDFIPSSENTLNTNGYIQVDRDKVYFFRVSSDDTFTLKTNAAVTAPWVAFDVSEIREDDMLQVVAYNERVLDGYSFSIGEWVIQNKLIYVCNTAGVQTGTFQDNIALWDILGTDLWERSGTTLKPKNSGDSVEDISFLQPLTTEANPSHVEGRLFYDNTRKALSYYNDEADVTVNIGQETLIPVRNETGVTITNGSIVYPSGVSGNEVLVGLADASKKEKSRLVGMVTHDIENNSNGYVTRLGEVSDLNTAAYSAGGIAYLSDTTPGAFTDTAPVNGSYVVPIGAFKIIDAATGSIVVDPQISELTVEVTDTNGFPSAQRSGTTISFDNGTRTFTIAPTGDDFYYYVTGDKFEKTTSESIVIADTEGLHVFYYDDETLTTTVNPSQGQVDSLIRTTALVAYVYWDATNSEYNYFGDERHGISMSPETHAYLHFTRGAQYLSGLALNTIDADANGDDNTSAQFGIDAGFYTDEDLLTISSAFSSTTGVPIYYLDGANGDLRRITNAGYSVLDDITAGIDTTGRLVWNEFTGATWQLTTVSNNDFVLCHVFAVNGPTGEDQIIAFVGQGEYPTSGQARAGAEIEIGTILTVIPVQEIIPLGTVIFQTSNGYDNDVRARVRSTDTGDDYVDWRTSELQAGTAPSSHNNLANLELATTGVTWGHINDQDQTITGGKSFEGNLNSSNKFNSYNTDVSTFTQNGFVETFSLASQFGYRIGDGAGGLTGNERSIIASSGSFLVVDSINTTGLIYQDDYSSNFLDNSLISKLYSDSGSLYRSDGGWTGDRTVTCQTNSNFDIELYDNTTSDWTERVRLDMSGQFGRVTIGADTGNGTGGFTATNTFNVSEGSSGFYFESTDGYAARYLGDYRPDMTTDFHIPSTQWVREWTGARSYKAETSGSMELFAYNLLDSDFTTRGSLRVSPTVNYFGYETGDGLGAVSESSIISLDGTEIQIIDTHRERGLSYDADYSTEGISFHGDRWIPDKGYLDSQTLYNSDGGWDTSIRTVSLDNNAELTINAYDTTSADYNDRGYLNISQSSSAIYWFDGNGAGGSNGLRGISVTGAGVTFLDTISTSPANYSVQPTVWGDTSLASVKYVNDNTIYGKDGSWTGSRLLDANTNGELQVTAYNTTSSTYTTKGLFDVSQAGISYYYATGNGSGAETGLRGFVSDTTGMFFNDTIDLSPVAYTYDPDEAEYTDRSIPTWSNTKEYTNLIHESSVPPYTGILSTIETLGSHDVGFSGNGIYFTPDGTKYYQITASGELIYYFTLSTPWDISTETYVGSGDFSDGGNPDLRGLHFNNDGTKVYTTSSTSFEWTLTTPYDTTGAKTLTYTWSHGKGTTWGMRFNVDGTKVFLLEDTTTLNQYSLSVAWDLSTVGSTPDETFDYSTQIASTRECAFDSRGLNLYILDTLDTVYQYKLAKAWDLSVVDYTGYSETVGATNARGLFLQTDSSNLFSFDASNNDVYTYAFRFPASKLSSGLPKGDLYMVTPIPTFVSTPGTPVNICSSSSTAGQGGVSAVDFTLGTNGRLTYTGEQTRRFDVSAIISVICNVALTTLYFYIAKNGTVQNLSVQEQYLVSVNSSEIVSVGFDVELAKNDYVEVYVDVSGASFVTPREFYFKARTQL